MMDRVAEWFTVEPAISLLMILAAPVWFASSRTRKKLEGACISLWLHRLLKAPAARHTFDGLI
jgi:hypothetical protein